jgi:UDP-N-acetylmuramoyl-tripeptide--D-alanyl-D-alanine ligase
MDFWSVEHLRQLLGGQWLARPAVPHVSGLTTDSRKPSAGKAFLALRGERFDGHDFLPQAIASGCPLVIVDKDPVPAITSGGVLRVADTASALLKLAHAYRRALESTKVIGVAGSNGKTTTVRLIDSILSFSLRGTSSPKSFNNAVGLPLTILSARRSDQYLLCEAGTNAPGELALLSSILEPEIGVVTSIGREHLEGFGTLRSVLEEEASLFKDLRHGGIAVLSADAPGLVEAVKNLAGRSLATIITFGFSETADVRIVDAESRLEGVRFTLNDRSRFFVPLAGLHNASNAAAAIAVGRRLGLPNDSIESALASAKGPEMRMERSDIAGVHFINDAYNANPESMIAAADVAREAFRQFKPRRRVLILGDMLELGAASSSLHAEIAEVFASRVSPDVVILIGSSFSAFASPAFANAQVHAFPDLSDNRDAVVARLLAPGDMVLLKGSRGMGLERVLNCFERLSGPPAEPKPVPNASASGPRPDRF